MRNAVFTIVQNESVFLPLWARYYAQHFNPEDIYILNHQSTDGSVLSAKSKNPGIRILPVYNELSFSHEWLRDTVSSFQRFLLQSYDQVLFAEADEIVAAAPGVHPEGLKQYMARNPKMICRCTGFEIVQTEGELGINWEQPLIAQRSTMIRCPTYSKPILSKVPLDWEMGFHDLRNTSLKPDPSLLLLHLHRIDYQYTLERHLSAVRRKWSPQDTEQGRGWQNRVVDPAEFDRWYKFTRPGESIEHIPDAWKEII